VKTVNHVPAHPSTMCPVYTPAMSVAWTHLWHDVSKSVGRMEVGCAADGRRRAAKAAHPYFASLRARPAGRIAPRSWM